MSKPVGPYTSIVKAGEWLIASGQVGQVDGVLVPGGIAAEERQALENLKSVLATENASLNDVVKTMIFLVDMADYAQMNEIYIEAFGDHRPARAAVAVAALPLGAHFEIEAWAHK